MESVTYECSAAYFGAYDLNPYQVFHYADVALEDPQNPGQAHPHGSRPHGFLVVDLERDPATDTWSAAFRQAWIDPRWDGDPANPPALHYYDEADPVARFQATAAPDTTCFLDEAGGSDVNATFTPVADGHGRSALASDGDGAGVFRYPLSTPESGYYRLWVWTDPALGGAAQVAYDVTHAGGTHTVARSQQATAGWVELGNFWFEAGVGGHLDVTDRLGGQAIADAVRLEPLGGEVAPVAIATTSLPEAEAGQDYSVRLNAWDGAQPYTWSITAGVLPDGLTLDPATGIISGTVTEAGSFVLTVRVSSAAGGVAEQDLEIVVPADGSSALLEADFAGGSLDGWTVVDEGTESAPSVWSAASGALVQSSNLFSLPDKPSNVARLGTYLRYEAGSSWTDYRVQFSLRSEDDDAIGLMFRVQDSAHYYRFSWDKQRGYRRLVKNVGGAFTVLAADTVPYVQGQTYQVDILAQGEQLEVRIDGTAVFSVTDTSLAYGTIAPYAWGSKRAHFDKLSAY